MKFYYSMNFSDDNKKKEKSSEKKKKTWKEKWVERGDKFDKKLGLDKIGFDGKTVRKQLKDPKTRGKAIGKMALAGLVGGAIGALPAYIASRHSHDEAHQLALQQQQMLQHQMQQQAHQQALNAIPLF